MWEYEYWAMHCYNPAIDCIINWSYSCRWWLWNSLLGCLVRRCATSTSHLVHTTNLFCMQHLLINIMAYRIYSITDYNGLFTQAKHWNNEFICLSVFTLSPSHHQDNRRASSLEQVWLILNRHWIRSHFSLISDCSIGHAQWSSSGIATFNSFIALLHFNLRTGKHIL